MNFYHSAAVLLSSLVVGGLFVPSGVHAHNFTPSEEASFLSLMDDFKSIILLVGNNVDNTTLLTEYVDKASFLLNGSALKEINEQNQRLGNYLSSSTLDLKNVSKTDVKERTNVINDIIAEVISTRIDKTQLENSTMHAFAISLDLNKVLDYYTNAFQATVTQMNNSGHKEMNMKVMNSHVLDSNSTDTKSQITKPAISPYEQALSLTNVTIDRFDNELGNTLNSTSQLNLVKNSLDTLKTKIEEKSSINDIAGLIHSQVQPALQEMFKLELE